VLLNKEADTLILHLPINMNDEGTAHIFIFVILRLVRR